MNVHSSVCAPLAAFNDPFAVAFDHAVLERKSHGYGRIVGAAFTPSFRQVASQQLYVRDAIDQATARVVRQLLGEIGQHLGGDPSAQSRKISAE